MPPVQVQPRPLTTTDAFEHQGGQNNFLIPAATVAASGLDGDAARWNRVKAMTVEDLFHLLGFKNQNTDDIGNRIRPLQLADIHAIGQCFQQHTGMLYPGRIYSCCCCT
jgi:hypothetical protein